MTTITLELTDDLAESITAVRHRLPEIIALGLDRLSPLPAQVYSYVLSFLASGPTPEQLMGFRPTPEMQERLESLLDKSRSDSLTEAERKELEEYERIEHIVVMLKARPLPHLTPAG
ncbi:MAG: hypothetical protein HY260_05410 [Chloroflexi bacterium]|nr:hypothetical protein [Chloroflexota bacterium]